MGGNVTVIPSTTNVDNKYISKDGTGHITIAGSNVIRNNFQDSYYLVFVHIVR